MSINNGNKYNSSADSANSADIAQPGESPPRG